MMIGTCCIEPLSICFFHTMHDADCESFVAHHIRQRGLSQLSLIVQIISHQHVLARVILSKGTGTDPTWSNCCQMLSFFSRKALLERWLCSAVCHCHSLRILHRDFWGGRGQGMAKQQFPRTIPNACCRQGGKGLDPGSVWCVWCMIPGMIICRHYRQDLEGSRFIHSC